MPYFQVDVKGSATILTALLSRATSRAVCIFGLELPQRSYRRKHGSLQILFSWQPLFKTLSIREKGICEEMPVHISAANTELCHRKSSQNRGCLKIERLGTANLADSRLPRKSVVGKKNL